MSRVFFWINIFVFSIASFGQEKLIISGPMVGPIELRDAKIWLEVTKNVKTVSLQYKRKARLDDPRLNDSVGQAVGRGNAKTKNILYKGELGNEFNPLQITIGGLDFNSLYEYQFILNGKASAAKGEFTTKD